MKLFDFAFTVSFVVLLASVVWTGIRASRLRKARQDLEGWNDALFRQLPKLLEGDSLDSIRSSFIQIHLVSHSNGRGPTVGVQRR